MHNTIYIVENPFNISIKMKSRLSLNLFFQPVCTRQLMYSKVLIRCSPVCPYVSCFLQRRIRTNKTAITDTSSGIHSFLHPISCRIFSIRLGAPTYKWKWNKLGLDLNLIISILECSEKQHKHREFNRISLSSYMHLLTF